MTGVKWGRAGPIGWVIAAVIAITLVTTYLTTPSVTGTAYAGGGRHHNKVSCDHHDWDLYVYVGQTRILARIDLRMKACWRHIHLKRDPGKIMKQRTEVHTQITNTGMGDFHGATWTIQEKYHPDHCYPGNQLIVCQARHLGFRQCVSVLGQRVCGPTADFALGAAFTSPILAKRGPICPGPCGPSWEVVFYQGEPNQPPGSFDDNVHVCRTMCR